MTLTILDVVLLLLLASFVISGFKFGFVHALGSLVGVAVGAYIASHYSDQIAIWIAQHVGGFDIRELGKWVSFLLIFFVTTRIAGLLFWFVEKTFGVLIHLPFLHSFNSLLGGVIGFFEGALVIGLSLTYAKFLPVPQFAAAVKASQIAPWFIKVSHLLIPLLPEALRKVIG